ncbi:MAG: hypothetical protein EPO07_13030, partial [Verrucomicrobia bacterium]
MKEPNSNPEDAKLSALLRESRTTSPLPPRFQEGVWRRIENAESPARSEVAPSWLDAFAALVLRPRFATIAAVLLIMLGVMAGVRAGSESARQAAQARYVAVVAPNS